MSELRLGAGTDALTQVDLPQDWHARQLSDFCSFSQGGRLGLTKQEHYRSSGIPAYSAAGQDGFVDVAEFREIDAVVLSAIGANCGRCFLAQGDWTTLANVQVIIPDAALADARFVHYRVNRDDYWPRSGSAQPFIKPSDMKACWIALPHVEQQKKIAQILDTLDTAIRETEALIDKLKAVKQGLLHDLLTRGIDANGQLRPPQSEAPQLYKESPLGWIPREWDVQPLAAYTASEITYGIVQAGPHVTDGVPYIRTGDMSGDALVRESMLCTSRRIANSYARSEVRTGEIVMAIRATVGKVLPVPDDLDGANLTQGTARISPNSKTDGAFLLWAIRHSRAQQAIQLEIKGTTFAEITLGALRQVPIAAPMDLTEQREIAKRLTAIDERLRVEQEGLAKRISEKSGLMDDLLTGRVRVTSLQESVQQPAAKIVQQPVGQTGA